MIARPNSMPQATSPADAPPRKDATPDVSTICPNCSAELQSRSCKLICQQCGFYLSCSDFY